MFAGIVVLLVILIFANRRAQPVSNSKNDRGGVPRWNSNAVGAFVGSFFIPLIPLIVAIVGIAQISETKQRGKGLAFAAIAIQAVVIAGYILFFAH